MLVGFAALIVAAVLLAVFNIKSIKNAPVVYERGNIITAGGAQDTDGDSLRDWEEALWKTNPKNPDTDGDGTSDSEEVRSGRDPLKTGPDDKREVVLPATSALKDTQSLNETDVFMRELLAKYFELKGSGAIDSQSLEKIAESMAGSVTTKKILPVRIYETSDILIGNDSPALLRSYGGKVGALFAERANKEAELEILSLAFSKNDPEPLLKLVQFQKEYISMIQKLLLSTTPSTLATTHLGLINELGAIASSVGAMSDVLSDPIRALSGISQYRKSLLAMEKHMVQVGSVFNANGVIFKPGEDGYLFTSLFERKQ